jgi:glucose/arabinose dehydrogenase
VKNSKPVGYEFFAQGWLQKYPIEGRTVNLKIMADASMLVSDDQSGRIYRMVYRKKHLFS